MAPKRLWLTWKVFIVPLMLIALMVPSPIFPRRRQAGMAQNGQTEILSDHISGEQLKMELLATMSSALQDLHSARRELREAGHEEAFGRVVDADAILTAELLLSLAATPAAQIIADAKGHAALAKASADACRDSAEKAREIVKRGF